MSAIKVFAKKFVTEKIFCQNFCQQKYFCQNFCQAGTNSGKFALMFLSCFSSVKCQFVCIAHFTAKKNGIAHVTLLNQRCCNSFQKIFASQIFSITIHGNIEVSEFLLHDKVFHWKNLLIDFYFVNFSVVKKKLIFRWFALVIF